MAFAPGRDTLGTDRAAGTGLRDLSRHRIHPRTVASWTGWRLLRPAVSKLADNCARIGICFESQLVDSLPQHDHDASVHWVVTEATVYPYVPDPPVIALLRYRPRPTRALLIHRRSTHLPSSLLHHRTNSPPCRR